MPTSAPLCPNCTQPMRLTRRIEGDALYHGQDVYECAVCRVAITQAAGPDGCGKLSSDK